MDKLKLDKPGKLIITEDQVQVCDFDAHADCREVCILACLWGIGQLQKELEELLREPGAGKSVIADESDAFDADGEYIKW